MASDQFDDDLEDLCIRFNSSGSISSHGKEDTDDSISSPLSDQSKTTDSGVVSEKELYLSDEVLQLSVQQFLFKNWRRQPGIMVEEIMEETAMMDRNRMLEVIHDLVREKIVFKVKTWAIGLGPFYRIKNVHPRLYRPLTMGIGRGKAHFMSHAAYPWGLIPIENIYQKQRIKSRKLVKKEEPCSKPPVATESSLVESLENEILIMLTSNVILTEKEIESDIWSSWPKQVKIELSEVLNKMLSEGKVFEVSQCPKVLASKKKEELSDAAQMKLDKIIGAKMSFGRGIRRQRYI